MKKKFSAAFAAIMFCLLLLAPANSYAQDQDATAPATKPAAVVTTTLAAADAEADKPAAEPQPPTQKVVGPGRITSMILITDVLVLDNEVILALRGLDSQKDFGRSDVRRGIRKGDPALFFYLESSVLEGDGLLHAVREGFSSTVAKVTLSQAGSAVRIELHAKEGMKPGVPLIYLAGNQRLHIVLQPPTWDDEERNDRALSRNALNANTQALRDLQAAQNRVEKRLEKVESSVDENTGGLDQLRFRSTPGATSGRAPGPTGPRNACGHGTGAYAGKSAGPCGICAAGRSGG